MASIYTIESFCKSDIGLIRDNNEDVFRELPKEHFYILADGMGGHNAGEIAASRAVEYMCSAIQNLFIKPREILKLEELKSHIGALIENTNLWVHHLGALDPKLHGMGTTLCSILFFKNFVIYSHVGDSRIYRSRNGSLKQLTRDHLVPRSYRQNVTNRVSSPPKILAQAIGTSIVVLPEVDNAPVEAGDVYLMCSDGLSDLVSESEINAILSQEESLSQMGDLLIQKAKEHGGHDNITLVLTRLQ